MSGYAPRRHKRKRKGLRFAVVVVLLALAGVVYSNTAKAEGKEHEYYRTKLVETRFGTAMTCLDLMKKITIGISDATIFNKAIDDKTQSYIYAFEGFCKPMPESIIEPWKD